MEQVLSIKRLSEEELLKMNLEELEELLNEVMNKYEEYGYNNSEVNSSILDIEYVMHVKNNPVASC